MKPSDNEKGAALLYVLMTITILMIMIPTLLSISSNRLQTNLRDEVNKKATTLAVSALESLLSYLDTTASVNYEAHFENYPGWGDYTINLPEGGNVHYQFGPIVDGNWLLTRSPAPNVTASNSLKTKLKLVVTVTKGSVIGTKELQYAITVPTGSGSGSSGGGGGGGETPSNTEVSAASSSLVNPATAPSNGLEAMTVDNYPGGAEAYQQSFNYILPKVHNVTYSGSTCSNWQAQLAGLNISAINTSPYDTVTILVDCGATATISNTINLLSKNVVLHIKGDLVLDNVDSANLNLGSATYNGMLLVEGNLTINNKGTFSASNVLITGTASYKETGNANVNVTGTFAAGMGLGNSHTPNITPDFTNIYTYLNSAPVSSGSPWDPVITN